MCAIANAFCLLACSPTPAVPTASVSLTMMTCVIGIMAAVPCDDSHQHPSRGGWRSAVSGYTDRCSTVKAVSVCTDVTHHPKSTARGAPGFPPCGEHVLDACWQRIRGDCMAHMAAETLPVRLGYSRQTPDLSALLLHQDPSMQAGERLGLCVYWSLLKTNVGMPYWTVVVLPQFRRVIESG
nr:hypothetical protein CFP56_11607 [Quercus suber]